MKDSNMTGSQSNGLFWGVDVASGNLDLGCHGVANTLAFDNSTAGIESLLASIRAQPAALIVVEATGGYETPLVIRLAEAGLPVVQ